MKTEMLTVLMGPNGTGKSLWWDHLMSPPKYTVTQSTGEVSTPPRLTTTLDTQPDVSLSSPPPLPTIDNAPACKEFLWDEMVRTGVETGDIWIEYILEREFRWEQVGEGAYRLRHWMDSILRSEGLVLGSHPDAFLYPRAQANLADFCIALALAGREVIIETHSMEFFPRLRLRAATNPTVASLIGVLFFPAPVGGVYPDWPLSLTLSEAGESEWPVGFGTDAAEEELVISMLRGPD